MPEYPAYAAAPVAVPSGGTGDRSLTAYELLAAGTTGLSSLQQIANATAGWILTSNGASALPSFQPGGGGGGGGLTKMPWNLLGGWTGSNGDIGLAIGSTGSAFPLSTFIYGMAVPVDTVTSFSKVIMVGNTAQTGSGSFVSVTDDTGAWVAHATNVDAAFTGISASPQFVTLTLNTTVTPPAVQTVYYVMVLCPLAVTTPPVLYALPNLPNWAPGAQSDVFLPDAASSSSGALSSIPNPQAPSGLTINTNSPIWCAFK